MKYLVMLALACSSFVMSAQQMASGDIQMSQAEATAFNKAKAETAYAAKAAAFEAYLKAYPNSVVKEEVLNTILFDDSQVGDEAAVLNAADRLLAIDSNNLQALAFEVYFRRADADKLTDPAAKQAALDAVAKYAQEGVKVTKQKGLSDADFATLKAKTDPIFEGAIEDDDTVKKANADKAAPASPSTLADLLARAPDTIGPSPKKYPTPFFVAAVTPIAGSDECGLMVVTNGMSYLLGASTDYGGCNHFPALHALVWGRVRHSRLATFLRQTNTVNVASDYVDLYRYGTYMIGTADAIGPDWGR